MVCNIRSRFFDSKVFIRRARDIRIVGVAAMLTFILLAFFSIFPICYRMDAAKGAAIPATPPSVTITSASNTASVEITPNSNGAFVSSDDAGLNNNNVTLAVATDNLTGYTLSINGNNTTGELVNPATGTTLATLSSAVDANTFATGSASTYINKYGIKPSKLNGVNNTNYLPAPVSSAAPSGSTSITVDTTSSANSTANNYTIGLGARVDYTKTSGVYTNTFTLTAVANTVLYEINYSDTTGDATVAGVPDDDPGISTQQISGYTLSSTTPTRTGYTFNKWCDGTVTHVASGNSTCSGTQYAAGANYIFSSPSSTIKTTVNLKAMWNVRTYNITIKTNTGISKVTLNGTECTLTSGCTVPNLAYGQQYNLVATLATGYNFASWSGGSPGTIASTTSASTKYTVGLGANTNIITPSATAKTYNITLTNTSATTAGSTAARVTYNSGTIYAGTSGTGAIVNPSRVYSKSGFSTSYNNASGATVTYDSASSCTGASNCKNTYTFDGWYTATSGGTKIITSGRALVASTSYTNASSQWTYDTTSSPALTLYAHWTGGNNLKLPTITKAGYTCGWGLSNNTTTISYSSGQTLTTPTSTQTLYGVCNIRTDLKLTITFASTGDTTVTVREGSCSGKSKGSITASGGSVSDLTYDTIYYVCPTLQTTSASNNYAGTYNFSSWAANTGSVGTLGSTSTQNTTFKIGNGNGTIKLTGSPTTFSGAYGSTTMNMQNMTTTICRKVVNGQTTSLTDTRDSKSYGVAKINGNCWMRRNLQLQPGKTVTSSDSNVSSSYTLPNSSTAGVAGSLTTGQMWANSNRPLGTGTEGNYYNYCAASAGTQCTSSVSGNNTYNICAKGWTLPSSTQSESISHKVGDYMSLFNVTILDSSGNTSHGYMHYPSQGFNYSWINDEGETTDTKHSRWWTGTRYSSDRQYILSHKNVLSTLGHALRSAGYYVRCVAK